MITLPSNGSLKSTVVLHCGIVTPDLLGIVSWITPQGDVVDETNMNPRYEFMTGSIIENNRLIASTAIQINWLLHSDSGNYICAVDSLTKIGGKSAIRAEASVQLILQGIHILKLL